MRSARILRQVEAQTRAEAERLARDGRPGMSRHDSGMLCLALRDRAAAMAEGAAALEALAAQEGQARP